VVEESATSSWRKSTASGQGNCVEVAHLGDRVLVRDSKDPGGPALTFSRSEWDAFIIGARSGEFNLVSC
jgi:hypothetical protein